MNDISHAAMANAVRALAMDAVEKAKSGHPGLPLGAADVATVLFGKVLKFDAADPAWPDRDRFVLSAGHGSMLLYALLYLTGEASMTLEEIRISASSAQDARPSRIWPYARRRTHDRPARPGSCDLGRHGVGRTHAGGGVRRRSSTTAPMCWPPTAT